VRCNVLCASYSAPLVNLRALAAIEKKHEVLVNQELDSVESIQARSAEMSKLSAMRELATIRQKKLKTAITEAQEAVIKLGAQIAALLEQRWWDNYIKQADQIKNTFDQLFYRSALEQNLQDSYVPIVLLQWLRVPSFNVSRFSLPDGKIVKCRQLRESANQLAEFESMSFAQIAARVAQLDRETREQAQRRRQIGSEPVLREPGN
jgi:hypothetical protein